MVKLLQILLSLFFQSRTPSNPQPASSEPQKDALIKTEALTVPASKPAKHTNNGKCKKCELIFNRYPGFHPGLKNWFFQLQANYPEAHISDAGRGKATQEEYFKKGSSKAHYGQSSHNFNAAIDIFKLHINGAEWPRDWFKAVVKVAIDAHNAVATFKIKWYGEPGSKFYELPHCEVDGWKNDPTLTLVEPL
jgi:hypothetical protein